MEIKKLCSLTVFLLCSNGSLAQEGAPIPDGGQQEAGGDVFATSDEEEQTEEEPDCE